ncbi:hypothetical protein OSTOST_12483, partial [Ostertagia ostertagi]
MSQLRQDIRICLLYEFKLGSSAEVALKNVERAFGEKCTTISTVNKWYSRFERGIESLENQLGSTVVDDDALEKMVCDYPYMTNADLARYFGVNAGTITRHLQNIAQGRKMLCRLREPRKFRKCTISARDRYVIRCADLELESEVSGEGTSAETTEDELELLIQAGFGTTMSSGWNDNGVCSERSRADVASDSQPNCSGKEREVMSTASQVQPPRRAPKRSWSPKIPLKDYELREALMPLERPKNRVVVRRMPEQRRTQFVLPARQEKPEEKAPDKTNVVLCPSDDKKPGG